MRDVRARARRAPGRPGPRRRRPRSRRRVRGRPTRSESARKYASAAAPPMRELASAPSLRQAEQLGDAPPGHTEAPPTAVRTIGRRDGDARTLRRLRRASPRSPPVASPSRGAPSRPGARSSCPSERTMTSAAASRSRRAPVRSGTTSMRETTPHERCALRRRDRRRRRSGRARTRARRSRRRAAGAPRRRRRARGAAGSRAAGRTRRRRDRRPRPLRPSPAATRELVRARSEYALGPPRRTRPARAERCSKRASSFATASPLRQPADVDAGDLRPGGELAPRAGEREADEDREDAADAGDDGERSRSRDARAGDDELAVHREANRRARERRILVTTRVPAAGKEFGEESALIRYRFGQHAARCSRTRIGSGWWDGVPRKRLASEDEELDPAGDVELDAGDVRRRGRSRGTRSRSRCPAARRGA